MIQALEIVEAAVGTGWFVLAVFALLAVVAAAHLMSCGESFMAGQRAAERRNRQQQRYDYDRGRVDGMQQTLTHLRETGQLIEFRPPPSRHDLPA